MAWLCKSVSRSGEDVDPGGRSGKGGISAIDRQNHIIMIIIQNPSFAGPTRPRPQKPEAGILFHPLRGVVPGSHSNLYIILEPCNGLSWPRSIHIDFVGTYKNGSNEPWLARLGAA
jgi:hypothetical protein